MGTLPDAPSAGQVAGVSDGTIHVLENITSRGVFLGHKKNQAASRKALFG
jgi:hypothetical protein